MGVGEGQAGDNVTCLLEGRETAPPEWAFRRYEQIRDRLPGMPALAAQGSTGRADDLGVLMDRFDAFLFDAFGVLNVGEAPIVGAVARVAGLQRAGKHTIVLSNAGSPTLEDLAAKYRRWGYDFPVARIVSSRWLLEQALSTYPAGTLWSVIAPASSHIDQVPARVEPHDEASGSLDRADGFLWLSSEDWTEARQDSLVAALAKRPRPVLIGNPDLVAPRVGGLTREPGSYAHDLADRTGIAPTFFGKPYANAFEAALARLPAGTPRDRVAMLGDTLHTDILGAAAAGIVPILVTGHGVLKGVDVDSAIAACGIVPRWIVPTI